MRQCLLGMAAVLCAVAAAPALAADYAPPPPAYYPPPPVQSSCCCPTVRRGLWVSPSACGYYQPAPVYYAPPPYAEPMVYQPGVTVGVRYKSPRKHCWRHHGHWVCR